MCPAFLCMPIIGSLNYASTLDLRGVLSCIIFLQLLLPTLLYHLPFRIASVTGCHVCSEDAYGSPWQDECAPSLLHAPAPALGCMICFVGDFQMEFLPTQPCAALKRIVARAC